MDTEVKDKLPREQPMPSGQKRRWESGAHQFWATVACNWRRTWRMMGGWNRIPHPWGVIELFSTDAQVSLAVSSAGGRAAQPYDGGLGNSLRTPAAREQVFERRGELEASVDRGLPPSLDARSVRTGSGVGPKTTRRRT